MSRERRKGRARVAGKPCQGRTATKRPLHSAAGAFGVCSGRSYGGAVSRYCEPFFPDEDLRADWPVASLLEPGGWLVLPRIWEGFLAATAGRDAPLVVLAFLRLLTDSFVLT